MEQIILNSQITESPLQVDVVCLPVSEKNRLLQFESPVITSSETGALTGDGMPNLFKIYHNHFLCHHNYGQILASSRGDRYIQEEITYQENSNFANMYLKKPGEHTWE